MNWILAMLNETTNERATLIVVPSAGQRRTGLLQQGRKLVYDTKAERYVRNNTLSKKCVDIKDD